MKLLLMGQNPKTKTNVQKPFKDTRSGKILHQWLQEAEIPLETLEFRNAVAQVGASIDVQKSVRDKIAKGGWVEEIIGFPVIVCLGRVAEDAIIKTRELYFPKNTYWDHYFIPHPSGLNRTLNDPNEHAEAVRKLKDAYGRLLTLKLLEGNL